MMTKEQKEQLELYNGVKYNVGCNLLGTFSLLRKMRIFQNLYCSTASCTNRFISSEVFELIDSLPETILLDDNMLIVDCDKKTITLAFKESNGSKLLTTMDDPNLTDRIIIFINCGNEVVVRVKHLKIQKSNRYKATIHKYTAYIGKTNTMQIVVRDLIIDDNLNIQDNKLVIKKHLRICK